MLPSSLTQGPHRCWRCRGQQDAPPPHGAESFRKARELVSLSWSVLQRDDLSAGAKLLYAALDPHDEYVVCCDPGAISAQVGLPEHTIDTCLNELTRAGIIHSRLGNLVFFG
jgi:hypothetical protein